jgi:hypothetical protein
MNASQSDPRHHTQKMKARLQEDIAHLREDVLKVDEPQLHPLPICVPGALRSRQPMGAFAIVSSFPSLATPLPGTGPGPINSSSQRRGPD